MPLEVTARSWKEIETHAGHADYTCSYSKYKSPAEFNFQLCPYHLVTGRLSSDKAISLSDSNYVPT